MRSHIPIPILILCATLLVLPLDSGAQEIATADLSQMKYRHIGPVGNRVTSVTGVVGDRFTYYAGAASGGVWKTDDAGLNWRPIFDDYPVHAIGEIAVAASDANIVWAGTGEPFLRSNVSLGNGVWKSTDAGENWTHMGLDATGRISRIIIHPDDPDERRGRDVAAGALRGCGDRRERPRDEPEQSTNTVRGHVADRAAHLDAKVGWPG